MSAAGLMRDEGGRTLLETLLVIIMVGTFFFISIERYISSARGAQEMALRVELSNLRTAVSIYTMTKGAFPESLRDLGKQKVSLTRHRMLGPGYEIEALMEINEVDAVEEELEVEMRDSYLMGMMQDEHGYPTDVFKNRFDYDPATGRVHSSTAGYKSW
ncbi:MAG: type II secretion system protein [Thermodesulfobacteriota bacterium]